MKPLLGTFQQLITKNGCCLVFLLRVSTKRDSISVVDNRNGKEYELGIKNGTLSAKEIQKIKLDGKPVGLRVYDPGYTNTCAATSRITYIDGPNGLLTYR